MVATDQERRVPAILRPTIRLAHLTLTPADLLAAIAILLAAFFVWFEQRHLLPAAPPLNGDARGFYERARKPHSFYAAHIREPLFPALLRTAFAVTGSTDEVVARQFSGWANIALTILIGLLATRLVGLPGGALATWLYAGTPVTTYYGVSGLRESSMGFLILLLVLLLLLDRTWLTRLGCALCAAAIPLLRLEGLLVVPLLVGAWALLQWRKSITFEAAALTLIAWLATAPFLFHCQREFGSAFHSLNTHATYWRNHEFAGQPGYLTRDEVLADAYAGPPTTSAQYVFGLHSLPQVLGRYATGYWLAFTKYIPLILSGRWLIWLWPVGVGWAIYQWREKGLIVAAGLIAQLPFAFIVPLHMVIADRLNPGVEFRFSFPLAPFVAILAAVGLVESVRWVLASSRRR